ncbi:cobalt chelatase [Azoarcus sp. PA01]|nr:cobalt chelatase [Azoarcus sp. PA01]
MMPSVQQSARRQQKVEALCAATLRALTGEPALHYRGGRLYAGERRVALHAPHLAVDSGTDGFTDCRAAADGAALRLLHSDAALHASLCPADGVERLVFELLEQLRVETLAPARLPGLVANLQRRFDNWSRAFHRSGLTEGSMGILLYTVAQMCWSRLNAYRVLEETEDYIESTRMSLAAALGISLAGIRRERRDQRAYAAHALEIARVVAERVRAERAAAQDGDAEPQDDDVKRGFALLLDFDDGDDDDDGIAAAMTGASKVFEDAALAYRVHTTRFDTEVAAGTLVRRALLAEYRERLDRRVAEQGVNLPRLARGFAAVLARPAQDGWRFGEEEGHVDGRRLAQLISSPAERRVFRRERRVPQADCVVSFLLDCSGSMKTCIEPVAVMLDVLIRALGMIDVATELLGFTTGAWNGGRAYHDWVSRGRPRHPGRLNEACHLVFKNADRSWRRARADIAALFKGDLFREGIDGEAVDWACNRLLARSASRRILVVISDGCPSDSATGLANDPFYLDNHLKEVVARRERESAVEIVGVGVGLDLSPFYRRSLATDLTQGLDNALFPDLVQLIGGRRRR